VQIKGRYADVAREAHEAVAHGADIVFIDTGRIADVSTVKERLIGLGLRDSVRLAFGGGVALEDVDALSALGVDILDVGRPIVDAPLLDMRFEVVVAGGNR
jgi:nicotinate-nucleotide pyrophosphorylase (carboxylating)